MDALRPYLLQDSLALSALSALSIFFVTYLVYQRFFSPLASIPGPTQARYGLAWLTVRALKSDLGWTLAAEHEKHGLVVRTGRNTVSICDPSAITEIYKYGSDYEKTPFYSFFAASPGTLMSTLPNHAHAVKRKAQSPAFAMGLLVSLEQYVDTCLDDLLELLEKRLALAAKEGKDRATIEMSETLQLLALDVVAELAFGKSFGLCRAGTDEQTGFLPIFDAFTQGACLSGTQPWASRVLLPFANWRIGSPGAGALRQRAIECVSSRVKQMQEEGTEVRKDILAKLFTAKHPGGASYTAKEVTVAAGSILGAGSDTTAITMRALLRFVVGDSCVYLKVMDEIESALENGELSFPISYADGTKLSYFQACLKETLRLHPAVPWTLPRVVPKGGAALAGHWFPAGTHVAMSPFVVHRRPEAYGKDAATFRPERWLEATEDERKDLDRFLLTFGHGGRICIGKNISIMEISKVIPTLLHRYTFSFTPRSATSPHLRPGRAVDGRSSNAEPWHCVSQWFAAQSDFWVDVKERQSEGD